jgi:hypothetical protein
MIALKNFIVKHPSVAIGQPPIVPKVLVWQHQVSTLDNL